MNDDGVEIYFRDSAESAAHSCEMMLSQGRKAKAQEYFTTAMYYYAKVSAEEFSPDFMDKMEKLRLRVYN